MAAGYNNEQLALRSHGKDFGRLQSCSCVLQKLYDIGLLDLQSVRDILKQPDHMTENK